MLIRKPDHIPSSEITPEAAYRSRRRFLAAAAAAGIAAAGRRLPSVAAARAAVQPGASLSTVPSPLSTHGEALTRLEDVTGYNNFYEFGVEKSDPAANAGRLVTRPWTVRVEGLVRKPQTFDVDRLLGLHAQEERVFRHRCVEAWSMVIPWAGYSLSELLLAVEPLATARYVQFLSFYDPAVMPWTRDVALNWPYSEGLRMDEAMNPLATLCFGLYGRPLPSQDGAPVRLVVPWKYGFKSAKSIAVVRLLDHRPRTAWIDMAPNEYGFYANVNPGVDHPRWTQKYERRIGEPFYRQKRATLLFNGYGDQVAALYRGMDLRRDY
jgi:sulfoxide reductase catalytic subunit YedY